MSPLRCLSLLLALSLSGCIIHINDDGGSWSGSDSPRLSGSGIRSTAARTTGDFRRVRVGLAGDVHVSVGGGTRVEVSGDDNLLEHVRTRVVDDELVIDTDGEWLRFREDLRVEIACPALEAATLAGSGTLKVEGLSGEHFDGSLSGSGDLVLRGQVEHVALSLTGSGELKCRDLVANVAQVSVSGSGDVHVHAQTRLSVSISGSGDVRYSGGVTQVTRSVAGSGTIAPE